MFTYFLVPVLHAGRIFVIVQLWVNLVNSSKIMFDSLNVHLHLVKLYEISVKRSARNLYNKAPSFGFDTCRHSVEFWKAGKRIFLYKWMKNSFSWEKTSSFERNTILRHFPGTLKVFTYPFLFNNVTLFSSRGSAQLACFAENRFISILASKMLASFSW